MVCEETDDCPNGRFGLNTHNPMKTVLLILTCGCLLYGADPAVRSGGSGPGCCASVLCGHILPQLERGALGRVLFIATGALMSQTTFLQKESIPAVAHLIELTAPGGQSGEEGRAWSF